MLLFSKNLIKKLLTLTRKSLILQALKEIS